MTTLRLLLGDQLNPLHPWLERVESDVVWVMMEVASETQKHLLHAQKVLGVFAAMRDFARNLRTQGHQVHYIRIGSPHNRHNFVDNLAALAKHHQASAVQWQEIDDHDLQAQLRAWAQGSGLAWEEADSGHFLSARDELARVMGARKQWTMEHWYRHMRKRHRVLLDDKGNPLGGQWNFDADNRKPWRGQPAAPPDWRHHHDHRALWQDIQQAGIDTFGQSQAADFRWPLNRDEALHDLQAFVQHALPYFGEHQDAMANGQPRLFHSLLSFALNLKMLHPREVIDAAVQAFNSGQAPLSAVEGFVRQILGWREYVRGIYWAHMPGYRDRNALQHHARLPRWFWTGDTRMACLREAIGQSLDNAHAHHIHRLMVIGNFALLAGLQVQAVHGWYLGVYVDALEWVELPNTLGMSQCADGGLVATKPYAASAAYIHRMSDHCKGCAYDHKQRVGDTACPFNSLYWDFFDRHGEHYASNHRLGMVYKNLKRFSEQELMAIRERAAFLKANLDGL